MSRKKVVWFEVQEEETIAGCLERMKKAGYTAVARKEEPLFEEVDGTYIPVKQLIKFKGSLSDS